jgi:putative methionine-R-sulfoxide reductase with GAF domain
LIGGLTAGFSSPLNAEQAGQTDVSSERHYERELESLGVIAQKLKYIGSTLGESLDLEHVLQEIVESGHQTIPSVERGVFHLLDEKGNVLRPVGISGVGRISKPSLAIRPGEGIAGYVLASGALLNVADIRLDPRYVADETGQGLRSLLVVPVQRKGFSLGTISAQSTTPNAFSAADEKLLTELAFRSTIAIENARLNKQEREQRLWAEVMAEASAALTHSQGRHCTGQPACQHADDGVVCQSAGWRGDPVLGCRKQRLGRSTCNPHPGWQAGGDHDQSGSVCDGHAVKTV